MSFRDEFTAMPTTPLADFLTALWETGQVSVPALSPTGSSDFSSADLAESALRLGWYASEERAALPGTPPTVSDTAALWGLTATFTACSLIVHRQHTVETFSSQFECSQLGVLSPSIVYSVDLTFRFLPDVHRLAMSLAESDPLCDVLEELGRQWPLSSVGMGFRELKDAPIQYPADHLAAWWHDACLRQLYLDRIADRGELNRLDDGRVAEAMRGVIGIHQELSPKIAAALKSTGSSLVP